MIFSPGHLHFCTSAWGTVPRQDARTGWMPLAFAEFVAGQIAEAVVGRVLVGFAERGVVEDLLDEFVDGQAVVEHHHADVNQFGGIFADDGDAQKFFVGAREDEFKHAGGVSGNVAAGVVGVMGTADFVVDFLFLAG